MSNLRFVMRDGKRILQTRVETGAVLASNPPQIQYKWEDVPMVDEPETPKLREWWLYPQLNGEAFLKAFTSPPAVVSAIHVVELPPGARVLTEQQVFNALDAIPDNPGTNEDVYSEFLRALGFEAKP